MGSSHPDILPRLTITFGKLHNQVMNLTKSWLGKSVKVVMDRPKNSKHPRFGWVYPVNYGYIPDTVSGDGMEIDAYVLKEDEVLKSFQGKVVAIIQRLNDVEDKLVVIANDKSISRKEIESSTYFQEQYYKTILICNECA